MATHDNCEWQRRQDTAAARELRYTLGEIANYEAILGLPRSAASDYPSPEYATNRLENLRRQVRRPVDPDNVDEINAQAIVWNDPRYFG